MKLPTFAMDRKMHALKCCAILGGVLAAHGALATGTAKLDINARVDCEERIQRVHWEHRIHSADDDQRGFRFDRDTTRSRIYDQIKRARLLDAQWQHPLTAVAIQAEYARVERDSRDRATLHDMYEALGNDPVLIGECLLRPLLAERLSRQWYEADRAIHAQARETATAQYARAVVDPKAATDGVHRRLTASQITPDDLHRLFGADSAAAQDTSAAMRAMAGKTTNLREASSGFDGWRVSMDHGEPVLDHWSWAKTPFETWWSGVAPTLEADFTVLAPDLSLGSTKVIEDTECSIGEWTATRVEDDFYPRWAVDSTAVWTGSEMLVFGDAQAPTSGVPGSFGGLRYTPATDSWRPMSRVGQFSNQYYNEGVWSGSELLLYGGCHPNPSNPNLLICSDKIGARYNPTTDTWRSMSMTNAPSVDVTRNLQWLGNRMFAWGGGSGAGAAATYDPVSNTWTPASAPPESRHEHYSLWTGAEVLFFGGFVNGTQPTNTNLAYKPSTNTWRVLSSTNAPSLAGAYGGTMRAWSGTHALIFTRQGGSAMRLFKYDPAQDSWSLAAATGTPAARLEALTTWTGDRLVIWGGLGQDGVTSFPGNGAMYLPQSDSWLPIRSEDAPAGRRGPFGIWSGSELIVWGGIGGDDPRSAARLNVTTNRWTPMAQASNGAPSPRTSMASASDGALAYFWGGSGLGGAMNDGGIYSASLDSWSVIPGQGPLEPRSNSYAAWSTGGLLVFGGTTQQNEVRYDGGIYDPAARNWSAIAPVPWPAARNSFVTASTAHKLIVWSGHDGSAFANDGYLFDLSAGNWTPMSTALAPASRFAAVSAVHDGKLYVWGGSGNSSEFNGGIFDPATNAWMPMPQSGDIPQGSNGSYVNSHASNLSDAGSHLVLFDWQQTQAWTYEIATGVWRKSTMQGRPSSMYASRPPTAVWSGREMLFWGGDEQPLPEGWPTNGYGYVPATDTWRSLETTNSPGGRKDSAGLAVGDSMMIWGGLESMNGWVQPSASGGLYCMDTRTGPLFADIALGAAFEQPVVSLAAPAVLVLRVHNSGPDVATQIRLTTDTGSDFVFNGLDAGEGASCTTPVAGESGAISCALNAIAVGAMKSLRITMSAFAPGSYAHSSSAVGRESDGNPGNNTATARLEVIGAGDAIFSSGFD